MPWQYQNLSDYVGFRWSQQNSPCPWNPEVSKVEDLQIIIVMQSAPIGAIWIGKLS